MRRFAPPLGLVIIATLSVSLSSCGSRSRKEGVHSPTQSLLGYHVNLPNTLTALAEQGFLGKQELQGILKTNNQWFGERKKVEALPFMPGRRRGEDADAVLKLLGEQGHGNGLSLRGKNLLWANLTRSTEQDQDLFGFQMAGADLSGIDQPGFKGAYKKDDGEIVFRSFTDLSYANMLGAELNAANLTHADLRGALLIGVDFTEANLRSSDLDSADLRWAVFVGTDLTEAEFDRADLAGVLYEPRSGCHPKITSFVSAKNLSRMRFTVTPAGLIELREAFKKAGLRNQERETTFAIKQSERLLASKGPLLSRLHSFSSLILFEWTTGYGMYPWRALAILAALMPGFALVYGIALFTSGRSAIWALRTKDAVHRGDNSKPVRISAKPLLANRVKKRGSCLLRAIRIACYFSVLSAFRAGFREANVGDWIERLQAREYALRATGWVRTVAGIQSLISVYLVAVWLLTYFGRPFD